jgi:hypothetical protein
MTGHDIFLEFSPSSSLAPLPPSEEAPIDTPPLVLLPVFAPLLCLHIETLALICDDATASAITSPSIVVVPARLPQDVSSPPLL